MIIPVILSGGEGIRLWPESRKGNPKPFLVLDDINRESLLQKTVLRALAVTGSKDVYIVTNKDYYEKTIEHLNSIKPDISVRFLLEGSGRNTAPAILLAALELQQRFGPECRMLILPADHLIQNEEALQEAVAEACILADQGYLVTFGIKPTKPETGYGYIKIGNEIKKKYSFEVEHFVEKPDRTRAQTYFDSGMYFWNSGMFCFRTGRLLDMARCIDLCLYEASMKCFCEGMRESGRITFERDSMNRLPSNSIDYAIMEKCGQVATVICDFGWSDVGTWEAIESLGAKDESGNTIAGNVYLLDSQNCYFKGDRRVVVGLGVEDLIVIDGPDGLLISARSSIGDIKKLSYFL